MLTTLLLINVSLGAQRTPTADTLCPPATQYKQAKRACILYSVNIQYNRTSALVNNSIMKYFLREAALAEDEEGLPLRGSYGGLC